MSSSELQKKFLEFFEKRGHKIIPSSSLIPDDPSVLLTTAGMQQFKKYYTEPSLAPAKNVASVQKCFRTSDIDEVGDESHLTFFEMLGHFSFGDYFKKETIEWTYELLTKIFKISSERISATVFVGDEKIPFDKESYDAWSKFLPDEKIRKGPRADNVWGPAGPEGPCGAANEVYVDDLEVATLVFMEYYCAKDGSLTLLSAKGVDVGWGFERIVKIAQDAKTIFDINSLKSFFELLPQELPIRIKRIIIDHLRASAFLIADGVRPSNKEAGYVLRRLLRRIISYSMGLEEEILKLVVQKYCDFYPELDEKAVIEVYREENQKFSKTLSNGLRELQKLGNIDAKQAFKLYESFGLPYEIIKELSGLTAKDLTREAFEEEFKKHQVISKAGQEKKFGGHGLLLDTGELKAKDEAELKKVTRLHTATHLLQAALRKVLGDGVKQTGSDITAERTRFDFSFDRKLTDEEIKKVEDLVNFAIGKKYQVEMKAMALEGALKLGALHLFSAKGGSAYGGKEKYPPKVKVYSVGDFKADPPEIFSRELCGGPHVKNTSEIGKFKILKQEAVGFGLRRIRATVTP